MVHPTRILISAVFATIAVACLGMWARSFSHYDALTIWDSHPCPIETHSEKGSLSFWKVGTDGWEYSHTGVAIVASVKYLEISYKYAALAAAALSGAPWMAFRFSLMTLFSLTTVVCLVLGIIASVGV